VALFYRVPARGDLSVTIRDVSGRTVRSVYAGPAEANGILAWDARDDAGSPVAAGVYFARLASAGRSETRAITVVR
jgi:hypothetical protein